MELAIDNIAGPLLPRVIETLGQNGRVSGIGQLAGAVPQFSPATLFFRRITMKGVYVGAYTAIQARQAWGTSRRVAVPLMEWLDRQGATQRLPDNTRRLR